MFLVIVIVFFDNAFFRVDCNMQMFFFRVFMIKFMEVWYFRCNMLEVFSQEDIPNIRVQIVNDLLFSKHNTADVNIVKNFNANVSFSFTVPFPFLHFLLNVVMCMLCF